MALKIYSCKVNASRDEVVDLLVGEVLNTQRGSVRVANDFGRYIVPRFDDISELGDYNNLRVDGQKVSFDGDEITERYTMIVCSRLDLDQRGRTARVSLTAAGLSYIGVFLAIIACVIFVWWQVFSFDNGKHLSMSAYMEIAFFVMFMLNVKLFFIIKELYFFIRLAKALR